MSKYTEADLKAVPQSELTGIPLLREQWDLAKAEPEGWDQGAWIKADDDLDPAVKAFILEHKVTPWNCGTTCCVAGRVALAKGARLTDNTVEFFSENDVLDTAFVVTPNGVHVEVEDFARNALELSESQARALFNGSNSQRDIEEMVRLLEEDPNADLGGDYDEDEDEPW